MDFSDLFEGWDVSQFLGVEALLLPPASQQPPPVQHPPSPASTSTSNSARQGPGSLEAQLSPAALPTISSLAGLTLTTNNPSSNAHSFFQQPRQPAQYPTRPPPPLPQDPRLRPRPSFSHVQRMPPPQRPVHPQRPTVFRTPNATSRFATPPVGQAPFTARPCPPQSAFPDRPAQTQPASARPCPPPTPFPVPPAHPASNPSCLTARLRPGPPTTPQRLSPGQPAHPVNSPSFPAAPLHPAVPTTSQRLSLADYRREKNLLQHPTVSSTPSSIEGLKKPISRNISADQEEGEIESEGSDESDRDEGESADVSMESVDEAPKKKELIKRGLTDHFVPLPEGWVEILHQCGMPVYYHLASRVNTWSRPYVSDKQERVRSHKVPISAFPCWDYQRALDEEKESQPEPASNANMGMNEPEGFAEILSGLEFKEKSMMSADQIHKYCSKLFEFKLTTPTPAKSPQAKRARREVLTQHLDKTNTETVVEKGLTVAFRRGQTRFILNAANRNPVALLHDFVFQSKKDQRISYECGPSMDSNMLFHTDALIDGKMEGAADGMSKKAAKQAAALDALRKLVPELHSVLGETFGGPKQSGNVDDVALFRDVLISDPRIGDIAVKAGVLPPYQILLRAVDNTDHDNVSVGGKTKVSLSTRQIGPNRNEYTCVAGRYSASVVHTSLVRAKQLCAQQILQELHPELPTYGEFLELYGSAFQEKKKRLRKEAKSLYQLAPGPVEDKIDWPRLSQLQEEMRKLIPEMPGALSSIRYV